MMKWLANGGPWLVLDTTHRDRLVASCPMRADADAIAALMDDHALALVARAKV